MPENYEFKIINCEVKKSGARSQEQRERQKSGPEWLPAVLARLIPASGFWLPAPFLTLAPCFLLLATAFCLPPSAFGTTVTGTVRDSAGNAVSGAAVSFRLINIGRGNVARDSGTSIVAPAVLTASSAADGTFSVTLVGNDAITPAGTLYEVVIRGPGFTYGPFDYSITGAAADLNSLTPEATYPNTPSQVPSSALAAPSGCAAGQDLEWTGTAWTCAAGASPTLYNQAIESNGTAETQRPAFNLSSNFSVADNAVNNRTDLDLASTISSNTSGNAATATALASIPSQCTGGQFATGIAASGNANCGTPAGGGTPGGSSGQVQINSSGAFGGAANLTYDSASGGTTLQAQDKGGQVFNVKAYGATSATPYLDGTLAIGSGPAAASSFNHTGTSTTATAPGFTATQNNTLALWIFGAPGPFSVPPATGTNRLTQPNPGADYGFTINDQTNTPSGSVAAVSGTFASGTKWNAITAHATPTAGNTISFAGIADNQVVGPTSITVTAPVAEAPGQFLVACVVFSQGSSNSITPPAGLTLLIDATTGDAFGGIKCYDTTVTTVPASYTWTQTTTNGMAAFVALYTNVDLGSVTLESPSAPFAAGNVGNYVCINGVGPSGAQVCGTISSFSAPTLVGLSGFGSATAGTGLTFYFGTDSASAINTTVSTCNSAGGGTVYFPPGVYAAGSTITLRSNCTLKGAGRSATTIQALSSLAGSADLLQSVNFNNMTDPSTQEPFDFGIEDMTIDGNKANRSAGSGGDIELDAYRVRMRRLYVLNAPNSGIYTQSSISPLFINVGDIFNDVRVGFNGVSGQNGYGLNLNGPTDSIVQNSWFYENRSFGLWANTGSTNSWFSKLHAWGNSGTGMVFATLANASGLESETNLNSSAGFSIQSDFFGTNIEAFGNPGDGLQINLGAGVLSVNIANLHTYNNTGKGLSYIGTHTGAGITITGLLSYNNTGNGVDLSANTGGLSQAVIIGNSVQNKGAGGQLVMPASAANSYLRLGLNTTTGQTAFSGAIPSGLQLDLSESGTSSGTVTTLPSTLPTAAPANHCQIWNNAGVVNVTTCP